MKHRRNSVRQLLSWLVAALLCVALDTQARDPDLSPDESSGTTIALQKNIADDAGKTPETDSSSDAVLSDTGHITAILQPPFSTARHLAAAYLATAICAAPRAPPLFQLV